MRFLRRGEDVKAYPAGDDGREAVRLLVPDGLSGCHALPRMVRPNLNCVFLHMLAVVEPFHGGDPIDAAWFGEIHLQDGMVRAERRRPERVGITVKGRGYFRCSREMMQSEVAGLQAMDGCAEFLQPGDIGIGQKAPVVGRQTKHELRSASYGVFVDRSEIL